MRKFIILSALLLTLSACGNTEIKDMNAAIDIAMKHSGLNKDNSEVKSSSLQDDIYRIEIISGSDRYLYQIDEENGDILSFEKTMASENTNNNTNNNTHNNSQNNDQQNNAQDTTRSISREEALSIALKHFNIASEADIYDLSIDEEHGINGIVYDIDFDTIDREYEITIDADGNIFDAEEDINRDSEVAFKTSITRDEAVKLALEFNNVSYDDVTDLDIDQKVYFDRSYYEIDYTVGHVDYDVIVDANTKEVKADND